MNLEQIRLGWEAEGIKSVNECSSCRRVEGQRVIIPHVFHLHPL